MGVVRNLVMSGLPGSAALSLVIDCRFALSSPAAAPNTAISAREAPFATRAFAPPLREPVENNLHFGNLYMHTYLSAHAFLKRTRALGLIA